MEQGCKTLLDYCSARFLLTSRSSEMVSLMPLPLGRDIQGLMPSPMTKMFVILHAVRGFHVILQFDLPSSECPVQRVLDMNNIETSNMSLLVSNNASSAHVTPTGDHNNVTSVEFDKVDNFVLFNVELDSVVYFDQRIRVADGSPIVCDDVWDSTSTNGDFADFQKLVGSFLGGDSVNGETALDVIEKAEVFTRFLDGNNIC